MSALEERFNEDERAEITAMAADARLSPSVIQGCTGGQQARMNARSESRTLYILLQRTESSPTGSNFCAVGKGSKRSDGFQ